MLSSDASAISTASSGSRNGMAEACDDSSPPRPRFSSTPSKAALSKRRSPSKRKARIWPASMMTVPPGREFRCYDHPLDVLLLESNEASRGSLPRRQSHPKRSSGRPGNCCRGRAPPAWTRALADRPCQQAPGPFLPARCSGRPRAAASHHLRCRHRPVLWPAARQQTGSVSSAPPLCGSTKPNSLARRSSASGLPVQSPFLQGNTGRAATVRSVRPLSSDRSAILICTRSPWVVSLDVV